MFATLPVVAMPWATHISVSSGHNGVSSCQTNYANSMLPDSELPPRAHSGLANEVEAPTNPGRDIDEWLGSVFGLKFDPFRHPNATEDVRLHEYLVEHELFDGLYQASASLVFAPAGGGKSAFRVRLARACRVGEGGRRLFPVVYDLPKSVITASARELWRAHAVAMLRAGAHELFLRLAYHPFEFDQLALEDQQRVVAVLKAWLQPSFNNVLERVIDCASLEDLALGYDATARWSNPPDETALRSFRQALTTVALVEDQQASPPTWDEYIELIVARLGYEAIYVLVDGVDAYPETFEQPERTWNLLQPLLDRLGAFAKRDVFLKAFLPLEMEASCPLTESVARDRIVWSPDSLRLLLQRRMEAASGMAPAGLNMLGDPGLFDLEERVIRAIRPSPRDALRFVERILLEHVRRHGRTGRLNHEDFQAALDWYGQISPTQ